MSFAMILLIAPGRRLGPIIPGILFALALATPCAAVTTLDGFVTQVDSPMDLYVGSLHVILNEKTQCEAQILHSDIQLRRRGFFHQYFLLRNEPVSKRELAAPCDAMSVRVGSRVQLTGDRGQRDGLLTAARLIVYRVDLQRKFATSWKPSEWSGGRCWKRSHR